MDLANLIIPGDAFLLNRKSDRLKTRLSKICIGAENTSKLLIKKGNLIQRKEFLDSWRNVAVLAGDILTVKDWRSEVNSREENLKLSEAWIEEWR